MCKNGDYEEKGKKNKENKEKNHAIQWMKRA